MYNWYPQKGLSLYIFFLVRALCPLHFILQIGNKLLPFYNIIFHHRHFMKKILELVLPPNPYEGSYLRKNILKVGFQGQTQKWKNLWQRLRISIDSLLLRTRFKAKNFFPRKTNCGAEWVCVCVRVWVCACVWKGERCACVSVSADDRKEKF